MLEIKIISGNKKIEVERIVGNLLNVSDDSGKRGNHQDVWLPCDIRQWSGDNRNILVSLIAALNVSVYSVKRLGFFFTYGIT